MVELIWYRKGRTIHTTDNKERKAYDSINLAKKESVKLQLSKGGLGAGSLAVIR